MNNYGGLSNESLLFICRDDINVQLTFIFKIFLPRKSFLFLNDILKFNDVL